MFIITDEDLSKFQSTVKDVLAGLASGNQRVDQIVPLGEDYSPVVVTGYWVGDIIRIDIKVKK